jgi:glucosyl-3-phosphoglycerate synthase
MDMWSACGARCDSTRQLIRRFHHSDFDLSRLLERKAEPVTVVLPAREVADTIGEIVERLRGLDPLIDQVLVVDAASADGTAEIARRAGAEVHQEADLMPEFGRTLGKGDAMWRALSVARGELVAYLDSDTRDFSPHFALGLLGPLICEPDVRFVKGFFRRPYRRADGSELPADGGRVTELTARPLLSSFFPELAAFVQPLAGEVAARRTLFERMPFASGYAVETAMLLHARDVLGGTGAMAQVDLDVRLNRHQSLRDLGPMAYAVLRVILERLRAEGRLTDDQTPPLQTADGGLIQVEIVERPPYARLRTRA